DAVSDQQTEPPITKAKLTHAEGDRCLQHQKRERDQRRVRISHHQLTNFRMRLDDRAGARRMRLIKLRLMKRGLHRDGKNMSRGELPASDMPCQKEKWQPRFFTSESFRESDQAHESRVTQAAAIRNGLTGAG